MSENFEVLRARYSCHKSMVQDIKVIYMDLREPINYIFIRILLFNMRLWTNRIFVFPFGLFVCYL